MRAVALLGHSGNPMAVSRLGDLSDESGDVAAAASRALATAAHAPPRLSIALMGGFEVRRGSWVVSHEAWERPVAARLARYLVLHRHEATPEDVLFELFWPDRDHAAARRGLQATTSRLRHALDWPPADGSVVEIRDRCYRLVLREGDEVDSELFVHVAAGALAETGAARLHLLEHAAELWRGEPLPEDRYADWTRGWREGLVDRYLDVLAALADARRGQEDLAGAIGAERRIVEIDALNEAAHRALMLDYARSGRRGHALRQYLQCRRRLVDELGVEPDDRTTRLQALILAGEAV
jgi:DNA-binding SARP family transcriptional activator